MGSFSIGDDDQALRVVGDGRDLSRVLELSKWPLAFSHRDRIVSVGLAIRDIAPLQSCIRCRGSVWDHACLRWHLAQDAVLLVSSHHLRDLALGFRDQLVVQTAGQDCGL